MLGEFFPAKDVAQAVDACRQRDRRLDMYHKFASPTARQFVELGFYSTHFGDKVDRERYVQCRDAIAPTLTEGDIRYLLRFETDPATRDFLGGLAQKLRKPKLHVRRNASVPATPQPAAPLPPPSPVFPANPPPRVPRRPRRVRIAVDAGLLKLLVVLAAVGGVLFFLYEVLDFEFFASEPQRTKIKSPSVVRMPEASAVRTNPTQEVARTERPAGDAPPADGSALGGRPADEVIAETTPAAEATVGDAVRTAAQPLAANRTRKLVLTDGISVRTRPDGTVEVPRAFSYAGARLKRPFWIYDRQLEKSGRIEYEARAEKAARDRWKALYDEAVRTATP